MYIKKKNYRKYSNRGSAYLLIYVQPYIAFYVTKDWRFINNYYETITYNM